MESKVRIVLNDAWEPWNIGHPQFLVHPATAAQINVFMIPQNGKIFEIVGYCLMRMAERVTY